MTSLPTQSVSAQHPASDLPASGAPNFEAARTAPEPEWDAHRQALLSSSIADLKLAIAGTSLEAQIQQLYRELAEHGLQFKPKVYLSDEWGCPSGVPVIGVPFYLVDERLMRLESELGTEPLETSAETMMYLRHEAGHAWNYAYRLYETEEWQALFGPFSRPYLDDYKAVPFSTQYVRHIAGWYAQKHPDEDFAETFAVWLTPGSNWRQVYAATGALKKLEYMDRIARELGTTPPLVTEESPDFPVEQINETLENWYAGDRSSNFQLPALLDSDLRLIFSDDQGGPAAEFLRLQRLNIRHAVLYWAGGAHSVDQVLAYLASRVEALGLHLKEENESRALAQFVAFVTTLVLNKQYTDNFVEI